MLTLKADAPSAALATWRIAATVGIAMLLCAPVPSDAQITQRPPADNTVYLELGGPGGFLSLNYERYLDDRLSARAGAASWSVSNLNNLHEEMTAAIASVSARWDISDYAGQGDGRFAEGGLALSVGNYSRSVNNALESRGGFVTLVPMGGLRYQLPQEAGCSALPSRRMCH